LPSRVLRDAELHPFRPVDRQLAEDPAAAQRALEQAVRDGHAEGMRRAEEEVRKAVEAEREKCRARYAASLEEVHKLKTKMYQEIYDEVMEVAIAVAERIVRTRIEAGDPVASRATREVLDGLGLCSTVKVHLNLDDHSSVLEICEQMDSAGNIELIVDPDIEPGGILVEYRDEGIDARLRTAFAAVRGAMTQESP